MRKSNNYYKFMEYVSYGKRCDGTICKDNGVLECTSYCTVSDIEYYENTTLGVENEWLKIKNVLINEEVINVYYVKGERTFYIATFILDNFKTQKELKQVIHNAVDKFFINNVDIIEDTETSETAEIKESKEDCSEYTDRCEETENAECSRGNDVFDGCKTVKEQYFDTDTLYPNKIAKIENINHCPNQNTCCIVSPLVHCNYNYKSDSCIKAHKNFSHDCEQVHKQMKAKYNPEWHHVRLETVRNIDFDMLDEKRQRYCKIYKELIKTLSDLHKCKTAATYEKRWRSFKQAIADDIYYSGTTLYMTRFLDLKISMCNVECGLWTSADEKATSFIKSRCYGRKTLKL